MFVLSRLVFLILGFGLFVNLVAAEADEEEKAKVIFHNELSVEVELFWEGEEQRVLQLPISAKGGEIVVNASPGHRFSYDFGGHRHFHVIPPSALELDEPLVIVMLGGNLEIAVECTTSVNGDGVVDDEYFEVLKIRVIPWWSPRGATHFLRLVRMGYYDGTALNRVVPAFLTQFGISEDYELRTQFRTQPILDDPQQDIRFQPGTMSFAGSGPNSRTTEVFIVMHDTPLRQLEYFGKENPWETPFAFIDYVDKTPVQQWYSYGDMPPWGSGPDPQKIYEEDGYEYLTKNFPKMDYIGECDVIEIEPEITDEL